MLKALEEVRSQLAAGEFEFTRHALRRVVERNIRSEEIRQAGLNAELIESYADDKYSPSVLLLGFSLAGRPLHLHVSLSLRDKIKIITLYEPDPNEWIDFKKRR